MEMKPTIQIHIPIIKRSYLATISPADSSSQIEAAILDGQNWHLIGSTIVNVFDDATRELGKASADMIFAAWLSAKKYVVDVGIDNLRSPQQKMARWAVIGVGNAEPAAFAYVTIQNADHFSIHPIDRYFESQDRRVIYEKLGVENLSATNAANFRASLGRLFVARDMAEGHISVEQITKRMIAAGETPLRYFDSLGLNVFDESFDNAFRGKRKREAIDSLLSHFSARVRDKWRAVFLHIADGGDGIAKQDRNGLDVEAVTNIVEKWYQIKGLGATTLETYLGNLAITKETFRKYKHAYAKWHPERWKALNAEGKNRPGRPRKNPQC